MADLVAAMACNGDWYGRTYTPADGIDPMTLEFADFVLAFQEAWNSLDNGAAGGDLAEDGCLGPLTGRAMTVMLAQADPAYDAWKASIRAWVATVTGNWQPTSGAGASPPAPVQPADVGLPPAGGTPPTLPAGGSSAGSGGALAVLALVALLAFADGGKS